MNIRKYFTEEIILQIQNAIKEANNNEVFFTGTLDNNGIVTKLKVGARGNSHTVAVNLSDSRKAEVLIHNHPSGNLTPSSADLNVAQDASENAQGFYIINNQVSDLYIVVEPIKIEPIKPLDIELTANYISKDGELAKQFTNYEERPNQIELLKNICNAFNNNSIGVFEAGTGVGKSYAYLIPSVLWALNNKEKIVISTGTINLQQQLCEKDLPAVQKILNKDFKFLLMKGRQNYICLRRLNDSSALIDLFDGETEELQKIVDWVQKSKTGSKSELNFYPKENVWTKVNSESDACMGMRCPYHNECFVMKVRKEANSSNILVVNHHLLFADIESRLNGVGYDDSAVLPPYRRIIFDEAHGIENAATSFFSESFSRFKLSKLLNQMYRKRKNTEVGHLCTLALISNNEEKATLAYDIVSKIKNSLFNFEIAAKDLIGTEITKRLYQQTARDFGPLLVSLNELSKNLGEFCELIRIIIEGIDDENKDINAFWESKIILRRLDSYVILLKNFCTWDERPENIYWIQKKRLPFELLKEASDPEYIILNETPLDISYLMNEGVYEPMQSVICTSATLRTSNNFMYFNNRTGIKFVEKERLITKEFDSNFPYNKNMLLAVPNDAPFSDSVEYQQYVEMALPRLIKAAEGRTLVLFTSYESLKSAYNTTKNSLLSFPGRIMRQGEDDNSKLLEYFKKEKESVLFATDSFWQGVDVPGESLSQVIIVKLPFTVPNDPVFVARSEAITKKGGNSFMELSVPEAIIKFRQGIGRLIRKSDDRGVITVLDRRIYEKRYGSLFINSIPECKKMYSPLSELLSSINNFIFN